MKHIDSTDNHKLRNIFSKIKCSSKTSLSLARRAVITSATIRAVHRAKSGLNFAIGAGYLSIF